MAESPQPSRFLLSPARRRLLVGLAFTVALVPTLWVFRTAILQAIAQFLIIDDAAQPTKFAVLVAAEEDRRPARVAELFHQGMVEVILVCQTRLTASERAGLLPDSTTRQIKALERHAVPQASIVVLGGDPGVTSTYEEAMTVKQYLDEQQYDGPLVIVTDAFHSRRARWIFARVFDGRREVRSAPAGYDEFDETDWWRHESGLVIVNNEYIKLGFYLMNYWNAGD